eukprot:2022362-Pleurochrysis_carterae.AAC.1
MATLPPMKTKYFDAARLRHAQEEVKRRIVDFRDGVADYGLRHFQLLSAGPKESYIAPPRRVQKE